VVIEDKSAEAIEVTREDGDQEQAPERRSPPIDEDVRGPVNAAVPPGDDEG
jgi:hypothetical protein